MFQISLRGDELVERALRQAPDELLREVDWALQRGAQEVAREERRDVAKATSQTANSIYPEKTGPLEYTVAPHTDYAPHIERGTDGPYRGMPPVQSILDWVKTVGITPRDPGDSLEDVAWAIARAIGERGTPAQPFVEPVRDSAALQLRIAELVETGKTRALTNLGLRPGRA
ncbi:HK97 gp10 family phage protein [Ectothiorhodospiraceae bacterium WFHF3C12]|nr:HK97 gp10 family phage protein [Ectothiorhodospiraceae bacterium WFHF3C12]